MHNYYCLNPIAKVGLDKLPEDYSKTEKIEDAEAIFVRSASMHEMDVPDSVLAVARAGAGVNNIPLTKLAEQGIVVFNTPGANANGVKELVIAGLFLASRDIVGGASWVQANAEMEGIAKAVEKEKKRFAGCEIAGKKLGVVGLGAIGVRVANAASDLGMEVYGYDPYLSVDGAWKLSNAVRHIKTLEEIYEVCDYITVHVPLLDSTKGMINKESISKMKPGVKILNFARDLLVNDDDMAEALSTGAVSCYVTDFPNEKTAGMKGCLAIPHLGASTEESEDNCAVMAAKQITDFIENGNIINSVNFPNCDFGVCKKAGRVTVLHKNVPNMIARFASCISALNVNISDMINKARGEYAYTMLDLDSEVDTTLLEVMSKMDGVIRVRRIK